EKYRAFFHAFEGMLEKHKLWLDIKVRRHILLMNAYFSSINMMLVLFNRVPLPGGMELTDKDFDEPGSELLLMLGAALDEEFNFLLMDLEVLMVGSIYKLDLSRPKAGFFAKRKVGKEVGKVTKTLYEKSLLGDYIRMSPV